MKSGLFTSGRRCSINKLRFFFSPFFGFELFSTQSHLELSCYFHSDKLVLDSGRSTLILVGVVKCVLLYDVLNSNCYHLSNA